MVYGHKVKFNGKWYMPGVEVPEKEVKQNVSENAEPVVPEKAQKRGRPPKTED